MASLTAQRSHPTQTNPTGFIYFLLLSAVFLMVAPAAIGHPLYFAGPSLDIAVLYLYSKHFQHENVSQPQAGFSP